MNFEDSDRVPIKHYPTINWNDWSRRIPPPIQEFQLNTIQRLTETGQFVCRTRRGRLFQLNTIQRLT